MTPAPPPKAPWPGSVAKALFVSNVPIGGRSINRLLLRFVKHAETEPTVCLLLGPRIEGVGFTNPLRGMGSASGKGKLKPGTGGAGRTKQKGKMSQHRWLKGFSRVYPVVYLK